MGSEMAGKYYGFCEDNARRYGGLLGKKFGSVGKNVGVGLGIAKVHAVSALIPLASSRLVEGFTKVAINEKAAIASGVYGALFASIAKVHLNNSGKLNHLGLTKCGQVVRRMLAGIYAATVAAGLTLSSAFSVLGNQYVDSNAVKENVEHIDNINVHEEVPLVFADEETPAVSN